MPKCVNCVLCSHLDHIGALPYFTEVCGYNGPIYMTVILWKALHFSDEVCIILCFS